MTKQKQQNQVQISLITHSKIIPDNYRFINLGLLFLVCMSNSIPLQAFAGVSLIISDIYKESTLIVSINWISYFLIYMIMVLPANYIIDQKGLKTATLISISSFNSGQTSMMLGLSLRCLINISMAYFLLGTLLCSFGFCLTISAANKLPSVWFLNRQIFAVKSLLIFALLCSDIVGFTLSTYFITNQSTKADVLRFLLIQSSIIGIFQIANIAFFKDLPQNSQNYFSRRCCRNFQRNIRKLVSNSSYFMLFLAITFIFIYLSVVFDAINQFERSYAIGESRINMKMLLVFVAGFLGCLLNISYYPNQYKCKSMVFIMVASMSHCLLWVAFETKQQWLIDISLIGVGMAILPLITTIVDWSAQCSFPVGEGSSGGSMFFGGYMFGSIATLLFGFYIGHNDTLQRSRATAGMLLTLLILSFLSMMLAEQKLKRKEYEQNQVIQEKIQLIIRSQSGPNEILH